MDNTFFHQYTKVEFVVTQANTFAEHELLPKKAFTAFSRQTPFSKASIQCFAKEVAIAPGIVVGQLQHKGLLPKSHCNDLKVRYVWVHKQLR